MEGTSLRCLRLHHDPVFHARFLLIGGPATTTQHQTLNVHLRKLSVYMHHIFGQLFVDDKLCLLLMCSIGGRWP